jgi:phage terminase small subunit
MPAQRLNPRERRFILLYLQGLPAYKAVLQAGYKTRAPRMYASELLTKPYIQDAIRAKMDKAELDAGVSAAETLRSLRQVMLADPGELFDDNGCMKPIKQLPTDLRLAIAGIEITEIREGKKLIGYTKKIRLNDRIAAAGKIAKHLGMFRAADEGKVWHVQFHDYRKLDERFGLDKYKRLKAQDGQGNILPDPRSRRENGEGGDGQGV